MILWGCKFKFLNAVAAGVLPGSTIAFLRRTFVLWLSDFSCLCIVYFLKLVHPEMFRLRHTFYKWRKSFHCYIFKPCKFLFPFWHKWPLAWFFFIFSQHKFVLSWFFFSFWDEVQPVIADTWFPISRFFVFTISQFRPTIFSRPCAENLSMPDYTNKYKT